MGSLILGPVGGASEGISVAPASLNFGQCTTEPNPTPTLVGAILNAQSTPVTITSITCGDPYTITPASALPVVLDSGHKLDFTVAFNPLVVGTYDNTVTIKSDAINSPVDIDVTGEAVASGNPALTFTPDPADFYNTLGKIKDGTISAVINVVAKNTGTGNVTITGATYTAPFEDGGSPPAYPIVLAGGDTLDIPIVFNAVDGYYDETDAIVIATDVLGDFDIEAIAFGIPVTSFHPVTNPTYITALAEVNTAAADNSWNMYQFNPQDFDTEADCVFSQQYDFRAPTFDKALMRVFIRYEDLGQATVNIQASGDSLSVNKDVAIGTVEADGKIKTAFADLVVTASVIELQVTRLAAKGPVRLVSVIPYLEIMGEVPE